MGVYLKGITEDVFKEISWECVYLALKRQDRIVEVKEPHGRLIDANKLINRLVFHTAITSDVKEAIEDLINEQPAIIEGSDE